MRDYSISKITSMVFLFGLMLLVMSCGNTNKKDISTSLEVPDSVNTKIETSVTPSVDSVEESDSTKIKDAAESEKDKELEASEIEIKKENLGTKVEPPKKKETPKIIVEEEIIENPTPPIEKEKVEVIIEEVTTPVEEVIVETPKEKEVEIVEEEIVDEEETVVVEVVKEPEAVLEDWPVPTKYKNKKNPVEADGESLDIGKMLYKKHCTSCHGKKGLGDGKKADGLETYSGDFTLAKYKDQSDGSLFYKIWIGRDEMPAYKKKIPDEEDIWHIINYTRTFK